MTIDSYNGGSDNHLAVLPARLASGKNDDEI